jgi:hypothetical protein
MSEPQQIEPKRVVAMIVALKPLTIDEDAIRRALGATAAKSLAEVSQAFSVSYATVKHTWRPAGMPGNSQHRQYPWADIVIWWASRNVAADQARSVSSAYDESERREMATIQLATARADLRIRETKLSRLVGEWVPLAIVQSVFRGILSLVRDGVMQIPQQIVPLLPAQHAQRIAGEVDGACRNVLQGMAAADPEDIVRRAYQEKTHSHRGTNADRIA